MEISHSNINDQTLFRSHNTNFNGLFFAPYCTFHFKALHNGNGNTLLNIIIRLWFTSMYGKGVINSLLLSHDVDQGQYTLTTSQAGCTLPYKGFPL